MTTIGYASFAAALVASGAAFVAWHTPRPALHRVSERSAELEVPSTHRSDHESSSAQSEEVRLLRNQVNQLNVEIQRLKSTVSDATGVPGGVEPAALLSREEEEQRWLDHVQALDRAFRDEPLTDGWSREMADEIRAQLAHDEVAADLVVDVECHSTTCKLELADLEPPRGERAIQQVVHKFSGVLQNATIAHDGDLTSPKPTALYLSRERPEDSVPLVARH